MAEFGIQFNNRPGKMFAKKAVRTVKLIILPKKMKQLSSLLVANKKKTKKKTVSCSKTKNKYSSSKENRNCTIYYQEKNVTSPCMTEERMELKRKCIDTVGTSQDRSDLAPVKYSFQPTGTGTISNRNWSNAIGRIV
ncbi:hypothetical protein EVAR_68498_1 [Eumeta japonica]|uniref:Uncharacterized protein n=1 Tax=Eumeta variegata TaxID=151549 RepID=A0A4C1ZXD3_EUMVA|nr:hypothetical protein EVAR_68498_1 [Eumeta japonica]